VVGGFWRAPCAEFGGTGKLVHTLHTHCFRLGIEWYILYIGNGAFS